MATSHIETECPECGYTVEISFVLHRREIEDIQVMPHVKESLHQCDGVTQAIAEYRVQEYVEGLQYRDE